MVKIQFDFKKKLEAGLYVSAYLLLAPWMVGPFCGTRTTNMSPYLLSVGKIGPSPLTSHLEGFDVSAGWEAFYVSIIF